MNIGYQIMDVQSQGNVARIGHRLDDRGIMVKFPGRDNRCFTSSETFGPTHPPIRCVPGAFLHAGLVAGL